MGRRILQFFKGEIGANKDSTRQVMMKRVQMSGYSGVHVIIPTVINAHMRTTEYLPWVKC